MRWRSVEMRKSKAIVVVEEFRDLVSGEHSELVKCVALRGQKLNRFLVGQLTRRPDRLAWMAL